jgi:hypothetical protein
MPASFEVLTMGRGSSSGWEVATSETASASDRRAHPSHTHKTHEAQGPSTILDGDDDDDDGDKMIKS